MVERMDGKKIIYAITERGRKKYKEIEKNPERFGTTAEVLKKADDLIYNMFVVPEAARQMREMMRT
ncbi:hypothetical protein FP828_00405 [bacterium]|nr:hypothetical protein [bacterium]